MVSVMSDAALARFVGPGARRVSFRAPEWWAAPSQTGTKPQAGADRSWPRSAALGGYLAELVFTF